MDIVPEFWQWLVHLAQENKIKLPIEIYEEIVEGSSKDPLSLWVKSHKDDLILKEIVNIDSVRRVVANGYSDDLTDSEIEQLGRDPFLIAYSYTNNNYCIVTEEISKPKKTRQNRKVPDVCETLGLKCIDTSKFIRELHFSTSWKKIA